MSAPPKLITSPKEFQQQYDTLTAGDIICCRLPIRAGEEHLLVDLLERGIHLIPSATAQLASRSKVYQARIFREWMMAGTTTVYDRHQLLAATNLFHTMDKGPIIVKQERKNAGIGILRYSSIEDLYTQAAHNLIRYPLVIQPYLENSKDLRVIVIGDYVEAYLRTNPHSFRNNLHCGGTAEPYEVSTRLETLSREIMARGNYPYAHLDFMLTDTGQMYLAEINLRGGLRGAIIDGRDYRKRTAEVEKQLVSMLQP